jgi:hypothetical protein
VPRTDIHDVGLFWNYRWHPKSGPLTDWGPNSFADGVWNYAGDLQDWNVRFPVQFNFKKRTNVFYRHALISETVSGLELEQREDLVQVSTSSLRWLSVDASLSVGTRPNYFPAGDLAPFLGDYLDVALGVRLKPISRLSIDETFLWSRLDGRAGTPAAGADIFENRIVRSRANYQFTREWSLRAILDYNSVASNRSVVDLEAGRHVVADILLTWLAHPGTALYIGYTDGYDTAAIDPTRRQLTPDGALRSTGRQLFVKSSWLFRFWFLVRRAWHSAPGWSPDTAGSGASGGSDQKGRRRLPLRLPTCPPRGGGEPSRGGAASGSGARARRSGRGNGPRDAAG